MIHWAAQYIGRPWVNGAQGPEAFDCYGFFRHVQQCHYGRDIAIIEQDADHLIGVTRSFTEHEERLHWREVKRPRDGDAVLMAHSKYPSHVGIWVDVDGGGVLHCVRGEGVVFSSLSALRNAGWGRVEFFEHAGNV